MMIRFCLSLLCLLTIAAAAPAQDVPLKKEDEHTYSFSLDNIIILKNFEIISGEETDEDDVYLVKVRALTPEKETDESISGKLLFEINGEQKLVDFRNGHGQVLVSLKDTDELVMKDVDSGITRKATLKKYHWYWVFMLLPGLVLLYLIFKRFAGKRQKTA